MGWILQCLLFVTLTSTSAYNGGNVQDYPRYENVYTKRTEYQYDPALAYTNDQTAERAALRTNEGPVYARPLNERPVPRMNERSISVTSSIQKVQEKERRRAQTWVEEPMARSENGSYKIVNTDLRYPTISTRRGTVEERSSDSVVFPGRTSAQTFKPEIPKDCEDIGICESIPNYPHDVVNSIISKLGDKLDRFHIDELEEPKIDLAQRIGTEDPPEIELCNFREMIIKPEAAKGKNGNWFVILNSKVNPLQGYRVEVCLSKDQTCAENIAHFYGGYKAVCKQKYVQRTMTAVDVDRREVLYDMPFRVPSCCSCVAMHADRKK